MIHRNDAQLRRPEKSLMAICPDCFTYTAHPVIGDREGDPIGECGECGSLFDETEAICA